MIVKYPTINFVEEENPWVTYAKKRVYSDNNCINLICTGGPGSGKSWSLLSYFTLIDPDFNLNEQCFFRAKELIKAFADDRIVKGKPHLFDEAGIDANSLKWQDEINKGLNAFFQTARHRNYIFGATVPFFSFISKGVRTLMNVGFEAKGWNSDNKNIIVPRVMEYNDKRDRIYYKRLIVKKDGTNIFCNRILLPKVKGKIIKEYEKLKKEFTTSVYKDILQKIEAKETKDNSQKLHKCVDVAKEIGITRQGMFQWINKGVVKARKIGDLWFMTPEERENILKIQEKKADCQQKQHLPHDGDGKLKSPDPTTP